MQYSTPKDLSNHFQTSLKTVYNYLKKGKAQIRIKKADWKTFIHFEDFNSFYNASNQPFNPSTIETVKSMEWKDIEPLEKEVQKLQSDLQEKESIVTDLTKYNSNLQDQVTKYSLLLTEEKNERKEAVTNFQNLLQTVWQERNQRTRKYYTLAIMTIVFGLILLVCTILIFRFDFNFKIS